MVVTTVEEDRWAAHRHTTLDMSARVARCGRACSQARSPAGRTAQESELLLPSQSKPIHCLRTSDRQHIQVAWMAAAAQVAWVEMMVAPWVACLVAATGDSVVMWWAARTAAVVKSAEVGAAVAEAVAAAEMAVVVMEAVG